MITVKLIIKTTIDDAQFYGNEIIDSRIERYLPNACSTATFINFAKLFAVVYDFTICV